MIRPVWSERANKSVRLPCRRQPVASVRHRQVRRLDPLPVGPNADYLGTIHRRLGRGRRPPLRHAPHQVPRRARTRS